MRSKNMKSVNLLWYSIVCLLVLLMTAKPIFNTLTYIAASKYELVELKGGEDSKGKEILEVDDDNKEPKLFTSHLINQNRLKKRAHSFFNFRNGTINYDPDIPIPPPRNFNRIEWL